MVIIWLIMVNYSLLVLSAWLIHGNGWEWMGMDGNGWLMDGNGINGMIITIVIMDHSRKFPAFSTSKILGNLHFLVGGFNLPSTYPSEK